jgi:tRNA(Ile)-lysidine synthase
MPVLRATPSGPALLRPFLALPRSAIDDYARLRSLAWVDDESYASVEVKRDFVRPEIAGRLAAAFPGYPVTLARSARTRPKWLRSSTTWPRSTRNRRSSTTPRTARRSIDKRSTRSSDSAAPRANLLRWFLRQHHLRPPSTARLAEMLRQLAHAAPDARVRLVHGGAEIGMHRGRVVVHASTIAPFALPWHGEALLALPHGTLSFTSGVGAGVACIALQPRGTTIRSRQGGERIRIAPNRPRQALKRLLHDAGVPVWQRESLPLVFCGETLAAVPGIGVDVAYQATNDTIGYAIAWLPGDGAG